ncbi:Adaptin N terminal region family protein [Histomonas meleagridis]|uniref:Adaptin N terminal region family protein n=1 Tax=Histomonas meleagridis TaxID=135588 RepID=UPI00355A9C2F|nr:Adaptin N terminal region family protein [Histomonas meleagridis]KAH0804410.1 Adaptin N terminal region family protein [Histomonas meleagridis]
MTRSLRDFITAVRFAENAEQEKFIISSEQADMRSYIRKCEPSMRPRIVSKLIFLGTLGENVSYGYMEVLTLMSHELFSYKRIGYIAASVMLDETSEISVLITQTVLKDLQSNDPQIQSLALAFIANNGSPEMCQTVFTEVLKHIKSVDHSVVKKAALASFRIIQKLPDLMENFTQCVQPLMKIGIHSITTACLNLMEQLIKIDPSLISTFQKYTKPLTKILKQLHESRQSKEFYVSTFNDPFLQIKIMKILSLLKKPSQELDDVLQSIVTGVDIHRNPCRSLLFQAVETVVSTANNPSLRGLAFTQVGRLLQMNDQNVLYSSLSVFSRVLYIGNEIIGRTSNDSIALQRYKSQIVHCLNNRDSSIRRRALNVVSALVDETNATTVIPEVLDYVKLADSEFRVELVSKLFTAIQRFAPNEKWNFDIVYRMLLENGNYVGTEIISSFCKMISHSLELQNNGIKVLSESLLRHSDNQILVQVACWAIGEYLQVDDGSFENMKRIMLMPQTSDQTKGYIITAITKLAVRINKKDEAKEFIAKLYKSPNLDVQQRAGEMVNLLNEPEIVDDVLAPLVQNENGEQTLQQNHEDDLLNLIDDYNKSTEQQPPQKDNSLLESLTETNITPPKGAVEALRMPDYVIYFEVVKNPNNFKQIAIRASIFNLGKVPLERFTVKFGAPKSWMLQVQQPSSETLEPIGGKPIFQQMMAVTQSDMPLMMKVQISYMYRSQPITESGDINPIFN